MHSPSTLTPRGLSPASGRGLLSIASRYEPHGPREECGVVGVFAPGQPVGRLTYLGLHALQHRGQESAGIATTDGSQLHLHKRLGLVSQVFDQETIEALEGGEAAKLQLPPSATPDTRPPARTRCRTSSPFRLAATLAS